jgi:hypothetical protein
MIRTTLRQAGEALRKGIEYAHVGSRPPLFRLAPDSAGRPLQLAEPSDRNVAPMRLPFFGQLLHVALKSRRRGRIAARFCAAPRRWQWSARGTPRSLCAQRHLRGARTCSSQSAASLLQDRRRPIAPQWPRLALIRCSRWRRDLWRVLQARLARSVSEAASSRLRPRRATHPRGNLRQSGRLAPPSHWLRPQWSSTRATTSIAITPCLPAQARESWAAASMGYAIRFAS